MSGFVAVENAVITRPPVVPVKFMGRSVVPPLFTVKVVLLAKVPKFIVPVVPSGDAEPLIATVGTPTPPYATEKLPENVLLLDKRTTFWFDTSPITTLLPVPVITPVIVLAPAAPRMVRVSPPFIEMFPVDVSVVFDASRIVALVGRVTPATDRLAVRFNAEIDPVPEPDTVIVSAEYV
jgi:hypothetical protein